MAGRSSVYMKPLVIRESLVSHTIILLFYLVLILCVGVSLLCVLINGRGLIMYIVSVNECTLCWVHCVWVATNSIRYHCLVILCTLTPT